MATQTRPAGRFAGGAITVSYAFDDVTGAVQSITCQNTSLRYGATITLRHPVTRVVYWTATHGKNGGTKTWTPADFPASSLTQKANPKPPGTTIWAANNLIELALA